jgi:hypothetical protein
MSKLSFASLIPLVSFAASAQTAAPQPPTPPGPPRNMPMTCARTGGELAGVLERHNRIATDRRATPVMIDTDSTFTLLETGAWTYEKFDATGKLSRTAEGCLEPARLEPLRALYTKATWKTTPVIHCMMATNSFTDYTFHGGVVWNARVCGPDKLDDDSAKAITAITTLIKDVTKPSEIELSRGKPTR